jgi:hypothetical protein
MIIIIIIIPPHPIDKVFFAVFNPAEVTSQSLKKETKKNVIE